MNDETIQRERRRARSLGEEEDFYSDPWDGGDQPRNELKKKFVFALALCICIPLLVLFALVVVVVTIAKIVPEFFDWVLR